MMTDIPREPETNGTLVDNGDSKKIDPPQHSPAFLPSGVDRFENQVSGHIEDSQGNFAGVLKCQNLPRIWKPFGKSPGCLKELYFYTTLNAVDASEDLRNLRRFVPAFHGIAETGKTEAERFFVLEDLTRDLKMACVADIKIGKKTHEPSATQDKIDFENSRYVGTKLVVGFCLPGAKFFSVAEKKWVKWDKKFGYKLEAKDAGNAIFTFLNRSLPLTKEVLRQLRRILSWFETENASFAFFASSVLVTYDAAALLEGEGPRSVRVKMIDFAHTIPLAEAQESMSSEGAKDDNYIHGLKNVIQCLEEAASVSGMGDEVSLDSVPR
ncbi:unnamed protein product [Cyprideis torosa]|uniref:Kinase n=1 Tax=Cyprideis torosa TaxID=163714 RepID=A0A7R8ZN99_9CRUS|nr:unnamed protein product [Cyprideis torosa]CAG0897542.1 unnamed protein product [Cyprideis torosa]